MRLVTWLAVVLVGTATAEATNPKIVGKAPVKPAPKPAVKPPKPGVQKPTSAANGKPASQTPVVVVTKSSAGPVKPSASKVCFANLTFCLSKWFESQIPDMTLEHDIC